MKYINKAITQTSNLTPCANVKVFPKLKVQVDLLMYYFQESEPDSRPPPVAFSPPNAPPISAPLGPILTLAIPQSEPEGPTHLNKFYIFLVNNELLNPCGTLLLISIASSKVLNFIK